MLQHYMNYYYSLIVLLGVLIGWLSYLKDRPIHQTLLWIFAALSSLYPAFSVWYNPSDYLNPIFLSAAKVSAAQSLFLVLLIPIFVLFVPKKIMVPLLKWYFLAEAVLVLLFGRTVMMGWSSYSSTMLALSIFLFTPFETFFDQELAEKEDRWLDFGMLVSIIGASFQNISVTAILIYASAVVFVFWKKHPIKVILAGIIGLASFIIINPIELQNGNGRYAMWGDYYHFWIDHLPKVLGTGLGTWEWIGPQVQGKDNIMGYSILHNDFWQILIEMGYIGFALFMIVFLAQLWRNRKNNDFLMAASGFTIAAMLYYPLHSVPGQVLCLYYFIYKDRAKI